MSAIARVLVLACTLAMLQLGWAGTGAAQDDTTRAREQFTQGVSLFQSGDYQRALDAFQEAYRLSPHASVRLNIANCYQQLDRPVEALFHFEHYLSEADHPTAAQRREIEASIRELRRRIGTLTFQVSPDGAIITIDGSDQRRAPVTEPVRVVQGRHQIEIRLEGYRTETQTVEVAGGADARVAIRLSRAETVAATTATATTSETATTTTTETTTAETTATTTTVETAQTTETTVGPTETTEPTEPAESHGGGLQISWPTILAASLTGAVLITALITGPLALQANDRFNNDVSIANDPTSDAMLVAAARADGESQASLARSLAAVTDVMLIASILGAGATVTLFILDQTNAPQSGESVAVVPVLMPYGGGVWALGRF